MTYEDYEFAVLERAERGDLPLSIIDDSIAPRTALRRMVDEGLLHGSVADFDYDPEELRTQFAALKITSIGRNKLSAIRAKMRSQRPVARIQRASLAAWKVFAAVIAMAIAILTAITLWRKLREPASTPPQSSPIAASSVSPTPSPATPSPAQPPEPTKITHSGSSGSIATPTPKTTP